MLQIFFSARGANRVPQIPYAFERATREGKREGRGGKRKKRDGRDRRPQ